MAFSLTAEVSFDVVQTLFKELHLFEKALHKPDRLALISETPATNPLYVSGVSKMFKHFDGNGRHIADSHQIARDGQVLHWDGKGVLVGDLYVWRRSEPTA